MWKKKKKEPQRRLRGREAARAAYTCCATDLQRRGESLEDRGDTAHGSEPLPGRRPHLQKPTGTWLRLIPGKSRTVHHSQYRSFTLWPDKMIFFFSCSGRFFLPLGSVSVRHAVTVWAQSVSDLVPDLLVHLKKTNKKRGEKKGNPFLLEQIWKARCPLRTTALLVCSHIKGRCLRSETRGTEGSATLSWNLIKPVEDRGGGLQNGMTHSGQLLFSYSFK